jgi:hypothetical protein
VAATLLQWRAMTAELQEGAGRRCVVRTGCRNSTLGAPRRRSEGARSEREEEWGSGLRFALGGDEVLYTDATAIRLGRRGLGDLWAGGGVGGEMRI